MPKALGHFYRKKNYGTAGRFLPGKDYSDFFIDLGKTIGREEKGLLKLKRNPVSRFFDKRRISRARDELSTMQREFGSPNSARGSIIIDTSQVTKGNIKGLIKHERLHSTLGANPQKKAGLQSTEVPEQFSKWLKKNPAYQNATDDVVREEYFAFGIQDAYQNRATGGRNVFAAARKGLQSQGLMKEVPTQIAKTKKGWTKRFWNPFGRKFSGSDDRANTVEGLRHGGLAEKLRRIFTPFSSGWDALRNLVKGAETFEDMVGSKGFQMALSGAKKGKLLGEGGFGNAHRMHGSFRGEEFSFVRKTGMIGEHEGAMMKKFGDDFAPSFYGEGVGKGKTAYLDMEEIAGESLFDLGRQRKLTGDILEQYEDKLGKMHEAGMVHADAALSNVMITKEGKVGLIDFGGAGPAGTEFRSHMPGVGMRQHRIGRTDIEMSRLPSGASKTTDAAGNEVISFGERSFAIDAAYSQDAWNRFLSTRAKDEAKMEAANTIVTGGTRTANLGPKSTTVLDSNTTKALTTGTRTKAVQASKKIERATMQEETTKALFANVTGGKNSRM
jgi:hypothetical protein